jgi:hypothetical protein
MIFTFSKKNRTFKTSTRPTLMRGFFCSVRPGVQLGKTNNSSLRMPGTAVETAPADIRSGSESEQL